MKIDLGGVSLSGAVLNDTVLSGAVLCWANLIRSELIGANLTRADLKGADLRGANLSATNLNRANLNLANLREAELTVSSLVSVNLLESDWKGVLLADTVLADLDLSGCMGLPDTVHGRASYIGVDTLAKTAQGLEGDATGQGQVETFFRCTGISEAYIDFFRAQIGQPIEFYSCFISYSHADKPFARRLYDSFQGRGIRCWLDEKEVRLGDPILEVVNQAIRVEDKLVLLCSRDSLASKWVHKELMAAFDREEREDRYMLIPLKLDETLDTWDGEYAPDVRRRAWGDFTGWEKDNAKFESEFEKVVQALRPKKDA